MPAETRDAFGPHEALEHCHGGVGLEQQPLNPADNQFGGVAWADLMAGMMREARLSAVIGPTCL